MPDYYYSQLFAHIVDVQCVGMNGKELKVILIT